MKNFSSYLTSIIVLLVIVSGCSKKSIPEPKPIEKSTATIITSKKEVFISGSEVRVPVRVVLDKQAQQLIEFKIVYGSKNSIDKGITFSMLPLVITKGNSKVDFDIIFDATKFQVGFSGVSHLVLTSNGANIGVPLEIILNVKGVSSTSATLSTDGTDVVVGKTDFEKSITVTLNKEALADVKFNILVEGKEGDYEIVDKIITVKKGEKKGIGVIKFFQKSFSNELMTGTAKISITTTAGDIILGDPNKLLLNIKGTGTAPIGTISIETSDIKVGEDDKIVEFSVKISETLTKDAVFAITATSDKDDFFTLNTKSITIISGTLEAKGTITFKASSFPYSTDNENVKVIIASEDVIINSDSTLDLNISGESLNPNIDDMNYIFQSDKGLMYVGTEKKEASLYFAAEKLGDVATKEHNIYCKITGGVEGVDYEWITKFPLKIAIGSDNSHVYLNVLPAGAGKTFKIQLSCAEATIGSKGIYTLTTKYLLWPPLTRQAPRLRESYIFNDNEFAVIKMGFGDDNYEFKYPCSDWLDLSEIKEFTLASKDAVLNISAFSIDTYHKEKIVLFMYADYNADGKFDGENEEVFSKKLENVGVGAENIRNFANNFTVPDGVSEFIVRVCVTSISGSDYSATFDDGYFVLPESFILAHMADFKVVVSE
ncbi:MAG: hypothetical protein IMY73_04135 [Bacteroidetes bacterium]|nr:hypothetical protein [Bacteroidota bacterium]